MRLRIENSPTDGEVHRRNIGFLQASSAANNLATFIALCGYQSQFSGSEAYVFFPGGPVNPRCTMVADTVTKQLLIVLNGMEGYDKVNACLEGWSNPVPANDGVLFPFETAAIAMKGGIPSPGGGSVWELVRVVGHSYGGACAPYLANLVGHVAGDCDLKVYTYGAPKNTIGPARPERITENTRRVFVRADPVPQLPLSYDNLSSLWVFVGTATARAWTNWKHEVSGLSKIENHRTVMVPFANSDVAINGPLGVYSLASWLTGQTAFGSDNHSLIAYQNWINYVAGTNVTTAPQTQGYHPPGPEPTRLRLERSRGVALAETHQAIAADPVAAAIGIQSGVPITPGVRYRGMRIGGIQYVLYGNDVVESVGSLRVRRAVVRQLNRGLGG